MGAAFVTHFVLGIVGLDRELRLGGELKTQASLKDVLGVWQGLGYNRQTPATKKQSSFANSDRQIRGAIVRVLLKEPVLARDELQQRADVEPARIERILSGMMGEGLVRAPGHDKTCEHNDKCKNHQSATDTE